MAKILKDNKPACFAGCDFVLQFDESRKNTKIKLLQITDMQFIDATQRRYPERLTPPEVTAWAPENFDISAGTHIRSLIAQTKPDMIFITGDIVYGSFDDAGTTLEWYCDFMDSLGIPWAPVFGNHDNESAKGVTWQCEQFEKSKYCMFKRGEVSGHCNYSVGIAVGDELIRIMHMVDSNGCEFDHDHTDVIREEKIFADQIELICQNSSLADKAQNKKIPGFVACHAPTKEYRDAEIAKGYYTEKGNYTIGADVEAKDDDFGYMGSALTQFTATEGDFLSTLKQSNVEAMFVGHWHSRNTCVKYEGIRWIYGLKTGIYDSHIPGQLGGTLVTLEGNNFEVSHVHSLVKYPPYKLYANMSYSACTVKGKTIDEDILEENNG
ncbi:MAG: metallophosphoesterase [Clostridia bacterium]|nr:metallophosphoesterase [Clostridia bacterium]